MKKNNIPYYAVGVKCNNGILPLQSNNGILPLQIKSCIC